ncbi:MAG: membrane protein of unknown function [Promethearchaeota archaeon]|nr:MAG: membrane protein of unknown function [Candidatus Lokiarchaeota archaeon]
MLFYQLQGEPERFLNFIGLLYESIVIFIAIIILMLIYLKYKEKGHELTLYLFLIFIFYVLGVFFSWAAKLAVVLRLDLQVEEFSVVGWFFYRILSFRISEFMICIAIFLSYVLKVKLFHEGFYNQSHKIVVIIFGSFTSVYVLIFYMFQDTSLAVLLDTIAFLLTCIFMGMIYIPFFYRSMEAYNSVKEPQYKRAFLSLAIMSVCYILIFFNFFLDRLCILLFDIIGFTPFYFLAWALALVAIVGAYYGYIRPKAEE